MISLPLALSGCQSLAGCKHEDRSVKVSGSVIEGATEVARATATFLDYKGGLNLRDFTWAVTATSLEGHITSFVLVNSAQPVPILLDLPIREPKPPSGYGYAYEGTLIQRVGEATPALGGIFEILASNNAVLEIRTDLPSRPLMRLPLTVTEKHDWSHGICF
jgi:hypothetical protein